MRETRRDNEQKLIQRYFRADQAYLRKLRERQEFEEQGKQGKGMEGPFLTQQQEQEQPQYS